MRVPILPAGTAVESVRIGGRPVQLANTEDGLAWVTKSVGTHAVTLTYRIDARGEEDGFVLALPVPAASAIRMTATLPGTGLDATVIPSAACSDSRCRFQYPVDRHDPHDPWDPTCLECIVALDPFTKPGVVQGNSGRRYDPVER